MDNLFRLPSDKTEITNKYKKLGFIRNPFPVVPAVKPLSDDDRENGSIFLTKLRYEEIEQFKEVVIERPNRISLLMDYAAFKGRGIGKTAFLNYEKRQINKDLGQEITKGEQVIYALYVCPGGEKRERKFWQIARLIYESVLSENLLLIAFCRLRVIYGKIPNSVLEHVSHDNLSSTIANDDWLEKHSVSYNDLNAALNKKFSEIGIDLKIEKRDIFKNSFEIFKDNLCKDFNDIFWRKFGVDIVFTTLVRVLKAASFSNGVILFDEAEKIIVSQNFSERREFCENLRHYFVDGNNDNSLFSFFKIMMTVHPYSQELLLPHWNAAGLERFSQLGTDEAKNNTIFFNPLKGDGDLNIAKDLASIYIKNAQSIPTDGKEILPFREDALKSALIRAEGIPGKYLKVLYNAIERAVSEDWSEIDIAKIESVWKTVSDIETNKDKNEQPMPESKTRLI